MRSCQAMIGVPSTAYRWVHFSTAAGDGCADATIEVRSRQIANLYDAHRRGAYGEAEWERQESGIIAASRKGRVRDAEPVNGWISK